MTECSLWEHGQEFMRHEVRWQPGGSEQPEAVKLRECAGHRLGGGTFNPVLGSATVPGTDGGVIPP